VLPTDLRHFLGGETRFRGYDILKVGPVDPQGRALGGNKFALANAEYHFDVLGPLRALLFFDAGQAFLEATRSTRAGSGSRPAPSCASPCRC
jgi:outer membrane translocation and assembly module TamA